MCTLFSYMYWTTNILYICTSTTYNLTNQDSIITFVTNKQTWTKSPLICFSIPFYKSLIIGALSWGNVSPCNTNWIRWKHHIKPLSLSIKIIITHQRYSLFTLSWDLTYAFFSIKCCDFPSYFESTILICVHLELATIPVWITTALPDK